MSFIYQRNATVAGSATQSALLQVDGPVAAVITPNGFATSDITFKGSYDGVNEYTMYNTDGTQMKITGATANNAYPLDLGGSCWIRHIRLLFSASQPAETVPVIVKDV